MAQNTSSAVMQQRHEPRDSLDDYPTPKWATRALCEWIQSKGFPLRWQDCREPTANRGYMASVLKEYFHGVIASDAHDYGAGFEVADFLFPGDLVPVDWTITNPPFRLASEFIMRALDTSDQGVAMLVRTAFLEGVGRYRDLFSVTPPTDILQFSERVVMHKGKVTAKGSTATAYCWVVWRKQLKEYGSATHFRWIQPCRKALERPGDYGD